MGRKERKRFELNNQVAEILNQSSHSAEDILFIKKNFTGIGGLASSEWDNGQFFTPQVVSGFMVDMMGIKPHSRVLEPSCGGGSLLEQIPSSCDIHAIELQRMASMATEICYPNVNVINDNALEVDWTLPFDYVIMNPPYGLKVDNWEFQCGKKLKSEIAFIEYGLKHLKEGGILGAIIPDGILANNASHPFRKWILDNHRLLAIVSLPTETFYHTGTSVKTSFMMIQKGCQTEDVLMAICKNIGWDNRGNDKEGCDLTPIYFEYEEHRKKNSIEEVVEEPLHKLVFSRDDHAAAGQLSLDI